MPVVLSDENVASLVSLLRGLQATSGLAPDLSALLSSLENNDTSPSLPMATTHVLTPPPTPHSPIPGANDSNIVNSITSPLPSLQSTISSALEASPNAPAAIQSPSDTGEDGLDASNAAVQRAGENGNRKGKGKKRRAKGVRAAGGGGEGPAGPGGDPHVVNWDPDCHRGGENVVAAAVWDALQEPAVRVAREACAALSLVTGGCALGSSNQAGSSDASGSSDSAWIQGMMDFLTKDNWAEEQRAFIDNSLPSLVKRCTRSIQLSVGLEFVTMVNFLQLATKVDR